MKFLNELEVVGMTQYLDVAMLRCHEVHFPRPPPQRTPTQAFPSVYTMQRIKSVIVAVHRGRPRPFILWQGRYEAPSADGCFG